MLDERLSLAASLYVPCALGADIGTDHALLPCELLERGVCREMILADISPKALGQAAREVEARGLAGRVTLRCADGLEALDGMPPCGCVSVTGMGGDTVAEMLRRGAGRLRGAALVLCAHTRPDRARLALREIGYRLTREEPCVCNGHAYLVWRAEPGDEAPYTAEELACGRLLFGSASPMLRPYVEMKLEALARRLDGLRRAEQADAAAIAEAEAQAAYYRAGLAGAVQSKIRPVTEDRKKYLPLLLLADEQEDMIDRYLGRGTMYVLEDGGQVRAECVVTDEGGGVLEIKSLAVDPACQGRGYGRAMIDYVAARYAGIYRELQVGTGDSPLTVPFYERCGFARHHVIKDFFLDNYDHLIFEGGVQLRDMVVLRKAL